MSASLAAVRAELHERITRETQAARVRVAALERIAGERARRERLAREFYALAKQRVLQPDATLRSAAWQAAPERLCDTIDRFNVSHYSPVELKRSDRWLLRYHLHPRDSRGTE